MKRVGYIYEHILSKEHIKETIIYASKHKTKRRSVKRALDNIDYYTDLIYDMLINDNIKLKAVRTKTIKENGKERIITISPFFPNQILDYLLTNELKPIIRKSLYTYCVGNIDKKGISFGKKYIEKNIKRYKYFLKLDIHHFYQSINTNKLIKMLEKRIKDKRFIDFTRKIISSSELPIGCYYSQWLSNFYLTELDHYIKEQLRIPLYVRYVDDMLLLGNNKRLLENAQNEIKTYLFNLDLELKRVEQVRIVSNKFPISFLGFKYYKNRTFLRVKIFKRLKRTINKLKEHTNDALIKRLIAYLGWLKQIKLGYYYYRNNIKPYIKIGFVRYKASLITNSN